MKVTIFAIALLVVSMIVVNAQAPQVAPDNQAAAPAARGGGRGGGRGAATNNPPPTSPVTGNATTGKKLYYDYSCYGCHGYNGETGRAFVGNWNNLQTEAGFIAFLRLRADQNPRSPSTSMPNFPVNTLSDAQAKDIYAYIRTFKSNAPELKDIPTLNTIVASANRPYKK
jgi:mono/diheme cytochrome c family protein